MNKYFTLFFCFLAIHFCVAQNPYPDTYQDLRGFDNCSKWGAYNVHDPSVIKEGEWYYMFSTDAVYGAGMKAGIQVRKSKDLVNWQWVGLAFDGIPQEATDHLARFHQKSGTIWAPCVRKVGTTFRLYWCVSAFGKKFSYLGLATCDSLEGKWKQQGCIVKTDSTNKMNAIDPTLAFGQDGKQFLIYGSYFGGIYCKPLDPATGKAINVDDKGICMASRDISRGNIEAAEVIYNPTEKKYYLFVSYDDLFNSYNVRVGRSDLPDGTYVDINGNAMSSLDDDYPMIEAPYAFENHQGWQGIGHCAVLNDNGQYFIINQARPVENPRMMVAHVRRIEWLNGFPVVSPERYAGKIDKTLPKESQILGKWENIVLNYKSPFEVSKSKMIELKADKTIEGGGKWSYTNDILVLDWNNGKKDTLKVWSEWDWENQVQTLVYSGFNDKKVCVWGKKIMK